MADLEKHLHFKRGNLDPWAFPRAKKSFVLPAACPSKVERKLRSQPKAWDEHNPTLTHFLPFFPDTQSTPDPALK